MPRKKSPTALEKTASVHEATVQEAEAHAERFSPPRRNGNGRGKGKPVNGPVSAITVAPEVMQLARELIRPGQRVRIINARTVMLENVPE